MYLPKEFVLADAIHCGELIDQAYHQYELGLQPAKPAWVIQGDYTLNGTFSAVENGQALHFGFVASENGTFYVVIRGTQTPLEWFDDASIHPTPFRRRNGRHDFGLRRGHSPHNVRQEDLFSRVLKSLNV